jgi:uncharacterized protein YuzE
VEEQSVSVRVTYDDTVDAAYIYLAEEPELGWRHGKTMPLDPSDGLMVNVDFDDAGRIMGIEVLGASSVLSEKLRAAVIDG